MKLFSLPINTTLLQELILGCFKQLPAEYGKAFEHFNKSCQFRHPVFSRETLISDWISIGTSAQSIFKHFDVMHRFTNILVATKEEEIKEIQIYLNNHGITGVSIHSNLEDLQIDKIDCSGYKLESLPVSPYFNEYVDLDELKGFEEIDEYISLFSTKYLIDGHYYCSIAHLSDQKCIAIGNNDAVYVVYTMTGLVKLLNKRPADFVKNFLDNQFDWLFQP